MEEVVVQRPSLLRKPPRAFRSFLLIDEVSGLHFRLIDTSLLYPTNFENQILLLS